MTTIYEPSQESIQLMLRQVDITESEAKQFLIKCNGNTFNAICCALGDESMMELEDKDIDINIADNDNNPNERISQFRNVLDKRDKKFMEITKEEDDVMDEVHNVGFVAFNATTNNYSKETYKMTLRAFIELVAKPFIETGELEEYKSMTFTEIKQNPNAFRKTSIDEEEMKIMEEENERIQKLDEERKELEKELKKELAELEIKKNIENEQNEHNEHNNIDINVVEETDDGNNGNIETIIQKQPQPKNTNSNKTTDAIREQLSKYIEETVTIKPLTGIADKMIRKWRCSQSGIIYKESNIKSNKNSNPLESILESKITNKLATKIMMNSKILKKDEYYIGNAIVVDKWYYYLLTRAETEESEKVDDKKSNYEKINDETNDEPNDETNDELDIIKE